MSNPVESFATVHTSTDIDEIAEIVRAIGRQQGQNAYYRVCYSLFKQLQDLILYTSNDLLRLYQPNDSGSTQSLHPAFDVVIFLQNTVEDLNSRAQRAQSSWEENYWSNCWLPRVCHNSPRPDHSTASFKQTGDTLLQFTLRHWLAQNHPWGRPNYVADGVYWPFWAKGGEWKRGERQFEQGIWDSTFS